MKQSDFRRGQKWRVVREGASLVGTESIGPYAQRGWSMKLPMLTVITCDGESWSGGDGVPLIKWRDEDNRYLANDCEFKPSVGGMWASAPADGYLELVWPKLTSLEPVMDWTLYEIKAAIGVYEYRLDAWEEFEKQPDLGGLLGRAQQYLHAGKPNFVVWDPADNAEGWLLVGTDAKAIGLETIGMIADSATEGPLALHEAKAST